MSNTAPSGDNSRTASVRPQQRRDVSAWRQFGALAYKNWLLKKRKPVSLILELLLPVAFMALLGALASSSSSQTNEPAMVDGAAYPVPSLAFLHGQAVSTPAQPNILCYDNNLFNLCACDYPKQALQEEFLSDINDYFQSGFNSNPLQALFQTSHSIKAYYAVCTGVAAAASSPALTQAQGCALAQNYHDLCSTVPTYPGVPTFPAALLNACPVTTTTIWSVADAEIVINNAIKAADLVGIGVSIPAASIETNCEAMHLAVVPLDTTWAAGQAGLSDTEAAALAFYQDIAASVGAESVLGFASMGALDDYVTQKGYSRDPAIPLVGVAVVFETAAPDWSYTLRSNYTMQLNDDGYRVERVPQTNSVTDTSMRNALSTSNYQGRTVYPFNQAYLTSGLLTLQQELDAFIMRQEGVAAPDVQYRVGFFPSPEFTQNDFWPNVGDMFAIVMVLVLMYPVSNVIRALVVDKELKLKEGMLQMGLGPKVYTLSWLFQFVMTFFVLAVLLTAIGAGSVFENSSAGIVFLFFFLFFLATIALCFFLASFFQKARSASTYGSLVFFLTVFPYFAVSGDGASASSRIGACVLPSTCFAVGTLPFKDYEGNGQGVTADTVSSHDSVNISMAQVLGMLLFDIVLYSFLAWYAGQVIKSEWGTNRPWYFLVTKAYWFPAAAARDDRAAAQEALLADETQAGRRTIEPVSETLRRQLGEGGASCVAMRGLTKTFPSPNGEPFKAVDMLDLTMYRGQITALLGHNGAGKTTTMNMLTGMMPVTSGRAYVTGLDVKSQMTQIRQDLGVCPQHDILYPDLTVVEHLRMFAAFKGVPRKRVKEDVDLMIKAVGLVEKRGEKSAGLSGGQKRKLSVAIAFIGGSRVVFLDEPTSGMDPHSRRFTWDVIRRQKEGRVIVLTTHFMDEADLLGDRIAIMSQGMLKCCGSSLFLKGLYGVGYNLTVVKTISGTEGEGDGKEENPADMQKRLEGASAEIEKLVRRHVRQAQVLSDVGAEVAFQLPTNASASFKPLLLELDDNKSTLCVGSYGMSVTTLEEVFIRVAHGTETAEERREISAMRQRSHSSSAAADGAAPGVARRPSDLGDIPEEAAVSKAAADAAAKEGQMFHPVEMTNAERFRRHVHALVVKRALTYKRDRKMVCFTTLAPAVFLLLGLLILLVFPSPDQPSLLLSFEDYNSSIQQSPLPYATTCDNADNVAPPPVCGIPPLITEVSTAYGVTPAPVTLADGTTQELNQWLLDNRASTFTSGASTYGAFGWNTVDVTAGAAAVDATVHSNFTAKHAAPLYNNLLSNAMLQAAGVDSTIAVTMWPLPATSFESNINDNTFTFPTVIFLMVGFAFIPAAWCGYVVRERETKSKHQQVVSGVSLAAYWASTYAWDMASFILTPPAVMALLAMFGKSGSLIDGAAAGLACFLLLLLWGPANMGCTYFLSFFFTSHSISMTTILFINWVFGLIAPLAVFFMLFFDSVKTIARVLKWVLRIHPGFCLGDGLLNLGNRAIVRFALNLDSDPTPFSMQVAGANLLYMLVEIFVYALLTLWVERVFSGTRTIMSYFSDKRLARRMQALKDPDSFWDSDLKGAAPEGAASGKKRGGWCCKSAGVEDVAMVPVGGAEVVSEDPDVLTERDRVSRGVSDVIQIQGLRKVYPASTGMKVAVRNMWLGVPKGQCFALLGINGAGKTTAISTLCGEQQPTQGRATLAGVDVAKDAEAVHRLIGYCPQFDALFESMTAREHLEMYARIKGLRESDVKAAAEAKMTEMDLLQYADKLAGGYSGGNKRKLSVAVAMLGGPEIVFLDEPSTGVDPVARRHMWEVISRIVTTNKQCALVLTTHSMEEAEALCQRIGIMVGGRLQCLGSAQHLKSRFGSGYQLEVTAALPTSAAARAAAQSLCASAGVAPGSVVLSSEAQVKQALRGSYPALESEISQDGRGSLLWQELLAEGSIQTQDVAEWALQESACNAILAFIARHFAGAQLLEKQGGKLRLALPPQEGMTLGAIFGLIEDSRAELGIGDYALGQTSLEQIFNGFAAKQAEETSDAPGRAADLQHLMADSTDPEKTGSGVVMLSADAAV